LRSIDEESVPEEKEKDLKDINWENSVQKPLLARMNGWLKEIILKPVCARNVRKIKEDMFPETVQKKVSVPTGKGKVRLESENYYFHINLLLKKI
jgi:hypothetical protein